MKICIPTSMDDGLEATSSGHFGSAPFFTLVDTQSDELTTIANPETGKRHGTCHPLQRLRGEGLDAIVCRSIGRGAFSQLERAGIAVYEAPEAKVSEIVAALSEGSLPRTLLDEACHGRARRHGEGRRHGLGGGEALRE